MLSNSNYVYDELHPDTGQEIRVLNLLPGNWADPIRCTIMVEKLHGKPESYEAVSYTWATEDGDDAKTSQVLSEMALSPSPATVKPSCADYAVKFHGDHGWTPYA